MTRHLTLAILIMMAIRSSNLMAQSAEIPVVAPESVGMSPDGLKAVDGIMRGYVDDKETVGGILMIARKGKICFFESYGLADRENGRLMEKDSILRFYSMTKAITTAGALMLCEEGKLDVNDPVSKFIPSVANMKVATGGDWESLDDLPVVKKQMTVADLMRHTSGLTYGWTGNKSFDRLHQKAKPLDSLSPLSELDSKLPGIPLRFEPGTAWNYGVSTDVLGRVVEIAAEQPFEKFLQERFFDPLDMRDTGFDVSDEKDAERFATCYQPSDDGLEPMKYETEKYLKAYPFKSGGGGLVSTARDYMRFLMMIERGGELNGRRYLKPETVKLMTTNQIPEGAGWIRFGDEIREGVGFGFGFCVRGVRPQKGHLRRD